MDKMWLFWLFLCSDISLLLALIKAEKGYNQFNVPSSLEQAAEVLRESRMPR